MGIYLEGPYSQRIQLGSVPIDVSQDFTIALFVMPENPATTQTIYAQLASDTSECPLIRFSGGNVQMINYKAPSAQTLATSTGVASLTWVHVAAVRNGTTNSLWTNGVQRDSGAFTTMSTPNFANIGSLTASSYLKGYIADVRIYQRALAANEIYALYASKGAALIPPDKFHLQAFGREGAVAANPVDVSPAKVSLVPFNNPTYAATPHAIYPPPRFTS